MDWEIFFNELGGREIRISLGPDSEGDIEIAIRLFEQNDIVDAEVLFFPEEVPAALMRLVGGPAGRIE